MYICVCIFASQLTTQDHPTLMEHMFLITGWCCLIHYCHNCVFHIAGCCASWIVGELLGNDQPVQDGRFRVGVPLCVLFSRRRHDTRCCPLVNFERAVQEPGMWSPGEDHVMSCDLGYCVWCDDVCKPENFIFVFTFYLFIRLVGW